MMSAQYASLFGILIYVDVATMPEKLFLLDAQTLRKRTRRRIDECEDRNGDTLHRQTVLKLLNDALAAELVCVQRYRRYELLTAEGDPGGIASRFVAHSGREQHQIDQIAARIAQLGGEPDFSTEDMLSCTHLAHVNGWSVTDMIKEDVIAECLVNDNYRDIIRFLGAWDPETQSLLTEILAEETAHAAEMATLLESASTH